jgi:hypothetical protein
MQVNPAINKISTFFTFDGNTQSSYGDGYVSSGSSFSGKKFRRFFRNSKSFPFIIVGIIVLGFLAYAFGNTLLNANSGATSADGRVNVKSAKATQAINREFSFPLRDQEGKEVSKFKVQLLNAELRDEIIVKGQRGAAVQGRTFLVLNIKIINDFDRQLQVNARDYVRLIVNNSSEKLAPEIHNDPVEVQAISTKYTRLGFPIDDNGSTLTLQVGEIKGDKQVIKLDLK